MHVYVCVCMYVWVVCEGFGPVGRWTVKSIHKQSANDRATNSRSTLFFSYSVWPSSLCGGLPPCQDPRRVEPRPLALISSCHRRARLAFWIRCCVATERAVSRAACAATRIVTTAVAIVMALLIVMALVIAMEAMEAVIGTEATQVAPPMIRVAPGTTHMIGTMIAVLRGVIVTTIATTLATIDTHPAPTIATRGVDTMSTAEDPGTIAATALAMRPTILGIATIPIVTAIVQGVSGPTSL